jgi:nucleotide-binding universal stress UspA family protein
MTTLRHILFPYDFSPQARQTAPFVTALAQRCSARITLLSVVPPSFESIPPTMDQHLREGDDVRQWVRRLQRELDLALVNDLAASPTERVALSGDPALRITRFAEEHDVDLIMMPTHGLGLYRRLLLGSVTSKVLHDATCAVWTAAHAEMQSAPALPRTIVCAVDGTPKTLALVKWAAAFSAIVGARLRLLHVVGPVSDWPSLASEQQLQNKVRNDARRTIESLLTNAGTAAPLRVAVGPIVQTVAENARQEGAELVIVGRGQIAEPFGRLRTHATGIIERSPCPVISV